MKQPRDSNLLLPFEMEILRTSFREYYKPKRNRLFATVSEFPNLWNCFLDLDEIWLREIGNLEAGLTGVQVFVGFLFIDSHTHFCTALELGFSSCIREASNILRTGIESAVHAHKVFREPHLLRIWAEKNDGKEQSRAYKQTFDENKKESLFPTQYGLGDLHEYWTRFCEWGAHTNLQSSAIRFQGEFREKGVTWALNAFESDPKRLALFLFSLLRASQLIERAFYDCFEARIKLDANLTSMRRRFEDLWEEASNKLTQRFNLGAESGKSELL